MRTVLRVIGGLLIVFVGCLLVIKSEWFLQNFGKVQWAEEKLGMDGGTRLFYKLLGVLICIVGIMMATNLLGGALISTVGKLFVPPDARQ
ncbi:MAG TPA: hypothetical protein VL500_00450 [Candidatus Eisenbacteria bacterium]|jgi:hypothetical protein|nr:hypothetical protein [Candidatus Eisenbacteria bacterium]